MMEKDVNAGKRAFPSCSLRSSITLSNMALKKQPKKTEKSTVPLACSEKNVEGMSLLDDLFSTSSLVLIERLRFSFSKQPSRHGPSEQVLRYNTDRFLHVKCPN